MSKQRIDVYCVVEADAADLVVLSRSIRNKLQHGQDAQIMRQHLRDRIIKLHEMLPEL